jgi:hypothetical protein
MRAAPITSAVAPAAVAVALGLIDLALGTDPAGSGGVPAAFQGVVGVKPTIGLVPRRSCCTAAPSSPSVSLPSVSFAAEPPGALDPNVLATITAAAGTQAADLRPRRSARGSPAGCGAADVRGGDALLMPTVPFQPTPAEVTTDPLGEHTECSVCSPISWPQRDRLPAGMFEASAEAGPVGGELHFGVTLMAPAFRRSVIADIAVTLSGEPPLMGGPDGVELLVVGAHRTGQPLNRELTDRGVQHLTTTRTAERYRLYVLATDPPKPGLIRVREDSSRIEGELWLVPPAGLGPLPGRPAHADGAGPRRAIGRSPGGRRHQRSRRFGERSGHHCMRIVAGIPRGPIVRPGTRCSTARTAPQPSRTPTYDPPRGKPCRPASATLSRASRAPQPPEDGMGPAFVPRHHSVARRRRTRMRGNRACVCPGASRFLANGRAEAELCDAQAWLPLRRRTGSAIRTAPLGWRRSSAQRPLGSPPQPRRDNTSDNIHPFHRVQCVQ